MGFTRSGKLTLCEFEHGPVERVDFPSYIAWWIFPVRFFVNVYQRVSSLMVDCWVYGDKTRDDTVNKIPEGMALPMVCLTGS